MSVQMAIVLGRLSAQNGFWEWQLRRDRRHAGVAGTKAVSALYRIREHWETIVDETNEPRRFEPSWSFRQHRQWWVIEDEFPWFFGTVYALFLLWGLRQAAVECVGDEVSRDRAEVRRR